MALLRAGRLGGLLGPGVNVLVTRVVSFGSIAGFTDIYFQFSHNAASVINQAEPNIEVNPGAGWVSAIGMFANTPNEIVVIFPGDILPTHLWRINGMPVTPTFSGGTLLIPQSGVIGTL